MLAANCIRESIRVSMGAFSRLPDSVPGAGFQGGAGGAIRRKVCRAGLPGPYCMHEQY
jgi:hypothetical protein